MDYIQENSVYRMQINWPTLRQEVYSLITDAQIQAQTYPAIEQALELLEDHHSLFYSPTAVQLLQQGIRQQIGLRAVHPTGIVGYKEHGSYLWHLKHKK